MLKCFLAYLGSSVKITVIYTHGHTYKEIFTLRLIGLKYGKHARYVIYWLYTVFINIYSTSDSVYQLSVWIDGDKICNEGFFVHLSVPFYVDLVVPGQVWSTVPQAKEMCLSSVWYKSYRYMQGNKADTKRVATHYVNAVRVIVIITIIIIITSDWYRSI